MSFKGNFRQYLKWVLPEVSLGVSYGERLPQLVGKGRAME
jgi:enoyl-CoA hydratase/carnithine racemase